MQRSFFIRLTQTALTLFAAHSMAAEAPHWYEVELVLIGYEDSQKIDDEHWSDILSTNISTNIISTNKKLEAAYLNTQTAPLDASQQPLYSYNLMPEKAVKKEPLDTELSVLYVDESIIPNMNANRAINADGSINTNFDAAKPDVSSYGNITADNPSAEPSHTAKTDPWAWVAWWNDATTPENVLDIQKGGSIHNPNPLEIPFTDQGVAFNDQVDRFKWAKGLTMIWNKKWRQPIPDQNEATAIENLINIDIKTELNSTKLADAETPLVEVEIKGHLYLYRSRYLHLVSNLAIQHWQNELAVPAQQTVNPASESNSLNTMTGHFVEAPMSPLAIDEPAQEITRTPIRAALIQQSRRMRSTELHYIDHPMVGILVRVTPIDGDDSEQ